MKKEMLISVGFSLFWAGLLALVVGGCGSNDLDRRPCAEDLPCPQPAVNACQDQNISSDRWTSLGLEEESVSAIAVHPCNPGIIYAGTQMNFSAGVVGKLFRSTDCGASWDTLAVGGSYHAIHFSPINPDVVYALNDRILKSIDGGSRWRRADEGIRLDAETFAVALAINPANACRLYAGTGGFYGGDLYRSDDGGESWRQVFEREVTAIAIDPADPTNIYIGSNGNVLRSTDGGDWWEATGLSDTGSLVDVLKITDNSRRIYAGIRFEGFFHAYINPFLDQWEQIALPDSIDNTVVDVTFNRGTVIMAGKGVLVEKDGMVTSYSKGIENKIVRVIESASDVPILFIGLNQLDNLGPDSGGIYVRRY